MSLKNLFRSPLTYFIFALGLGVGYTIQLFWGCGLCNNSNRLDVPNITVDRCEPIDLATAQQYLNNTDASITPYGAWIGKELFDYLFKTYRDHNGVFVFLGKDASGNYVFMAKSDRIDKRTTMQAAPDMYYKLDGMCPTTCDGLDPRSVRE
jgi:hypothetical protein